jgi:hypothetical protein
MDFAGFGNVQREMKNVQFGLHLNDIPGFCQAGKTAGKNVSWTRSQLFFAGNQCEMW